MQIVLFQTIQFGMITHLNVENISISNYLVHSNNSNSANFVYAQLNVKTVLYITIKFNVSTVSMSKTVPFQTIQFSISTQLKCKYSLIVKKPFYFKLFNIFQQF